jgi:hypothetical protein
VDKQPCFLFWCKNAHAPIVLPRKAYLPHRILSGFATGDGHRVQVPQKDQFTLDRHITSPLLLPLTPIAFKIESEISASRLLPNTGWIACQETSCRFIERGRQFVQ